MQFCPSINLGFLFYISLYIVSYWNQETPKNIFWWNLWAIMATGGKHFGKIIEGSVSNKVEALQKDASDSDAQVHIYNHIHIYIYIFIIIYIYIYIYITLERFPRWVSTISPNYHPFSRRTLQLWGYRIPWYIQIFFKNPASMTHLLNPNAIFTSYA